MTNKLTSTHEQQMEWHTVDGLKVLLLHHPGSQVGSVQCWFRAGSALEKKELQGSAHFLEHLFFKGTTKRPQGGPALAVDRFGGEFNAFTSFDYTCYYINCPKDHLLESADIIVDMVSDPLFKNEDVLIERNVVLQEYKRSQDNPSQVHFQLIQKHCFPAGYQHPILGESSYIEAFTLEQIKQFRDQYYHTADALLIIAGDLSQADQRQSLLDVAKTHRIPKPKSHQRNEFPTFTLAPYHTLKNDLAFFAHHKEVAQMTVTFTLQGDHYDSPKLCAQELLLSILGQNESSRLYQRLVKKSATCTSMGTSTLFLQRGSVHFLKLSCPDLKKLEQALGLLLEELESVLNQGISAFDVAKMKNQYVASKLYEKESLESMAFSAGHSYVQTGDIYADELYLKRIEKVQWDDLKQALIDLLTTRWYHHAQLKTDQHLREVEKVITKFDQQLKKLTKKKFTAHNSSLSAATKLHSQDTESQVINLKPGIDLLYRYSPQPATFAMQVLIKAGQSEETKANCGSSYHLARLLNAGHRFRDDLALKKILDFKSATLQGQSGKNSHGLMLHGQSKHFQELAEDFIQCLLAPGFNDGLLKREKLQTLRGLKIQEKDPVKQCFKRFQEHFYQQHPYGLPSFGTEASIKKLTVEGLKKWHQKYLQKSPIAILYSGANDLSEVMAILSEGLADLKPRSTKIMRKPVTYPKKSKIIHHPMDREQVQVLLMRQGLEIGHRDSACLKILSAYWQGQSSPLFLSMRDELGLCYSVAPVAMYALEGGHWGVYIGTTAPQLDQALQRLKELELELSNNGLSEQDLKRTKEAIKGQRLLGLQTNDDYTNFYAPSLLFQFGADFEWRELEYIEKVTSSEFKKFVAKFFAQPTTLTTVGKLLSSRKK